MPDIITKEFTEAGVKVTTKDYSAELQPSVDFNHKYIVYKGEKILKYTDDEGIAKKLADMTKGTYAENPHYNTEEATQGNSKLGQTLGSKMSTTHYCEKDLGLQQGIYVVFGVDTIYSKGLNRTFKASEDMYITDGHQDNEFGFLRLWNARFEPVGFIDPKDFDFEDFIRARYIGLKYTIVNIRLSGAKVSSVIDTAGGNFAELVEYNDRNGYYKFIDRAGYIDMSCVSDIGETPVHCGQSYVKSYYFKRGK